MKPSPAFPKVFKVSSKPHKFCPGCGHPVILKMLGQALDEMGLAQKTIFLVDIGCSLLAWDFFDLPTSQTHHGRTVPTAVGFKMADPQKIVVAYVGDGGAYAIGLQHTISSCLRDNPITTIVVNNTVYAMTGGQMAPTTTDAEITTTTPAGMQGVTTLRGPELLKPIASPQAYLARGSSRQPLMLKDYLKKALATQIKGHYSLVESLSACPLNWQTDARQTLDRLESLEKVFPLGEIK
ncbi:2-oxoglutarate synthase [Candidatus Shapirobacteria bacterium CG09_land_8_20_14_0_10_49_15]|uniref:2-oxoglutarate synthase n=2 Tax=Candidatus Shapironibacteriota TaxID=1752721 RepID=A0A2M8L7A0_9BACT|nr:MAG: 2-oxoglutarate synthase [Candidatus Shapirobacteria bacterium CG09_land_8_20_14_0_10_49_15]PJE70068.1 MAG: 2-oxoglutarate synthase [Candidatus Shapirobacteria bacterium CG10_big_fil_rev_8_21_14_0_10_48_15]